MKPRIKLAVLNITTYGGVCSDAEHYYGKLVLTDITISPAEIHNWNTNHLGEQIQVSRELTLKEAKYLDEKDYGNSYVRAWHHDQKKTDRFNAPQDVVEAGIGLWKAKQQELGYGFPFVSLYEGERVDDITVEHQPLDVELLSFDEWCDANEEEINIELAENGADRELDFNPEKEFDERYEKYLDDNEKKCDSL